MTTLATPPSEAPQAPPPDDRPLIPFGLQLSHVSADLLPDEIRAERRLRHLKRRLIFVPVALILIIVLGDMYTRQQTGSVRTELSQEQAQTLMLNGQLDGFTPFLDAQASAQQIQQQLATITYGDLSWSGLLNSLQKAAPDGVHVGAVSGTVGNSDSSSDSSGSGTPAAGATALVGSLTISGTAPDYHSVADYVHVLAGVRGLVAVNPSTVGSATGHDVNYTINLSLTPDILGGRFTAPTDATTGSATSSTAPTGSTTTGTTTTTGVN